MKVTLIPRKRDRRKKRVAAYCRVSTGLDSQEESFEMQVSYYRSYIMKHPEWEFAGIYSDEKSGTRTKNRRGFQSLIRDAVDGKIDLILVKSISRFSRNIVDCEQSIRILRGNGVNVIFEREGINTVQPGSAMIFSLLAIIAQDESRSISENMKWSNVGRVRRGEYNLGCNRVLGYDSVGGKLLPNGDAWIVRLIFHLFIAGNTYRQIADAVEAAGGSGLRNGRMESKGIRYILQNETYRGDKLLQKQAPKNFLTKLPERNAKFESNYLSNDHEAIIEPEMWEQAQNILEQRTLQEQAGLFNRGRNNHFLYGKIICGECGAVYTRRTYQKRRRKGLPEAEKSNFKAWSCAERRKGKNGNGCRNRIIRETQLLEEIHRALGEEWTGASPHPEDAFWQKVRRVVVTGERIEVERRADHII